MIVFRILYAVWYIISMHTLLYKVTLYIGILASNSSSYSVLLCHFLSSQIVLSLRTTAPEMQTSQQEEEEWQGGTTFGTDVAKSQSNKLSH